MDIGFEIVAAKPKGLRLDDQPAATSMRGERKITKNPSTDQKKIRRAQQRKTASMETVAALTDVGDCQICGGTLRPRESAKGDTTLTASCADCATTHALHGAPLEHTAGLGDGLDEHTLRRLANVNTWMGLEKMPCPDCGSDGFGTKRMGGHSHGPGGTFRWHVLCKDCGHHYKTTDAEVAEWDKKRRNPSVSLGDPRKWRDKRDPEEGQDKRTAAAQPHLEMLGFRWVPQVNADHYVTGGQPLSAIARRAREVSATPEEMQ